jgi:phenylpropionate dioxygenase-like ring-hydroxylating dioxygenase large terminal subunit
MDAAQEFTSLARRALAHLKAKTTDQAETPMALPVGTYIDEDRYRWELERIFRRLPLGLALSIEIPEPGSYRALRVLDVPLVIVRGDDGVARAFINACRHRGTPVCENGHGKTQRFVCPYHAWTYDERGALVAVYGSTTFGDIDRSRFGLTELPCAERAGLVWVSLTPGATFDIDDWLGEFAPHLESLRLTEWHLHEQHEIAGPGWKVAWDGYLEAYHHNLVHANTVGKYTIGNLLCHDTYGPHQRLAFARRSLSELLHTPEAQWQPQKHIRLIHSVFPNLSISGVVGDHCLVSQLYPGASIGETLTRQTVLAAKAPVTPEERQATATFSDMVLRAVRDEDYAINFKIQAGLRSGGNREFTIGRNEPAVQHYHKWVAKIAAPGASAQASANLQREAAGAQR